VNILFLESDASCAEVAQMSLTKSGHNVQSVSDGKCAIRYMARTRVDLLLLDWNVPDLSVPAVLCWARTHICECIPALILGYRCGDEELEAVFAAGADDYVSKPVHGRILAARVNALLRRAYPDSGRDANCIKVGPYLIDIRQRAITLNGHTLDLTPREFDLASLLFRHVGQTMLRSQLCRLVWGRNPDTQSRSLDTHISRLRHKLQIYPLHGVRLRTLYQLGYCLEIAADSSCPAPRIEARSVTV